MYDIAGSLFSREGGQDNSSMGADAPISVLPSPFADSNPVDMSPAAPSQGVGGPAVATTKPEVTGSDQAANVTGSDRPSALAPGGAEGKAGEVPPGAAAAGEPPSKAASGSPKQETPAGGGIGGAPVQAITKAGTEPATPAKTSTGGTEKVPTTPAASVPVGPSTPEPGQKLKKQGSIRKMLRVFTPEGRKSMKEEKAAKKLAKQASSAGTRGRVPSLEYPPSPSVVPLPGSSPPQQPPSPPPAFGEISPAPLGGDQRPPAVRYPQSPQGEITAAPLASSQQTPPRPSQPAWGVSTPAPLGGDRRVGENKLKLGPERVPEGPPAPTAVSNAESLGGPGTGRGEAGGKGDGTAKKAVEEQGALKESGPQGPSARPKAAEAAGLGEPPRRSPREGAGTKDGAYTVTSEFGEAKVLRPRAATQSSPEPSPRCRFGSFRNEGGGAQSYPLAPLWGWFRM